MPKTINLDLGTWGFGGPIGEDVEKIADQVADYLRDESVVIINLSGCLIFGSDMVEPIIRKSVDAIGTEDIHDRLLFTGLNAQSVEELNKTWQKIFGTNYNLVQRDKEALIKKIECRIRNAVAGQGSIMRFYFALPDEDMESIKRKCDKAFGKTKIVEVVR